MTAENIVEALTVHHQDRQWACFPELYCGTGLEKDGDYDPTRRIDFYAMNLWPSKKFERIAYEIKTCRTDWRKERAKPEKRDSAMSVSNQFYYITNPGFIDPSEVPADCGLYFVVWSSCGTYAILRLAKKAVRRACADPPLTFVAALARRIHKAE